VPGTIFESRIIALGIVKAAEFAAPVERNWFSWTNWEKKSKYIIPSHNCKYHGRWVVKPQKVKDTNNSSLEEWRTQGKTVGVI